MDRTQDSTESGGLAPNSQKARESRVALFVSSDG